MKLYILLNTYTHFVLYLPVISLHMNPNKKLHETTSQDSWNEIMK